MAEDVVAAPQCRAAILANSRAVARMERGQRVQGRARQDRRRARRRDPGAPGARLAAPPPAEPKPAKGERGR